MSNKQSFEDELSAVADLGEFTELEAKALLKCEEIDNKYKSLMVKSRSKIKNLEANLAIATAALENIQCQCSVDERNSGHLIDCTTIAAREALNKLKTARGEK